MADGNDTEKKDIQPKPQDRRRQLRGHLLVLKVKGEQGNKGVFFGYAKNLSRTGMFIASINPKEIGEEFTISFRLPVAEPMNVRCRCMVVWRREFDPRFKEEPGMGIEFLDLDPAIEKKIDDWATKQ